MSSSAVHLHGSQGGSEINICDIQRDMNVSDSSQGHTVMFVCVHGLHAAFANSAFRWICLCLQAWTACLLLHIFTYLVYILNIYFCLRAYVCHCAICAALSLKRAQSRSARHWVSRHQLYPPPLFVFSLSLLHLSNRSHTIYTVCVCVCFMAAGTFSNCNKGNTF